MEKITLRDYLAGEIAMGQLASQDMRPTGKGTGIVSMQKADIFAKICYQLADAMVKESKKKAKK